MGYEVGAHTCSLSLKVDLSKLIFITYWNLPLAII